MDESEEDCSGKRPHVTTGNTPHKLDDYVKLCQISSSCSNYYRQARVHCPVLCFLELIWLTSLVHDQKTAKRVHPVDIENVKRKSFNSQQPFEKISGVHTVVTLN